jgi:hypothetical protein
MGGGFVPNVLSCVQAIIPASTILVMENAVKGLTHVR